MVRPAGSIGDSTAWFRSIDGILIFDCEHDCFLIEKINFPCSKLAQGVIQIHLHVKRRGTRIVSKNIYACGVFTTLLPLQTGDNKNWYTIAWKLI